jgi:hypothetical protein
MRTYSFAGFTAEASFGGLELFDNEAGSTRRQRLDRLAAFCIATCQTDRLMGGVARMLLTHKDDIAAHESFRNKFGCTRVMHRSDGASRLGVELVIDGEDPREVGRGPTGDSNTRSYTWPRGLSLQAQISIHWRSPGMVSRLGKHLPLFVVSHGIPGLSRFDRWRNF